MTAGFSVSGVKKLGRRSGLGKSNSRAGDSQVTDLACRDKPRALLGKANSGRFLLRFRKRSTTWSLAGRADLG